MDIKSATGTAAKPKVLSVMQQLNLPKIKIGVTESDWKFPLEWNSFECGSLCTVLLLVLSSQCSAQAWSVLNLLTCSGMSDLQPSIYWPSWTNASKDLLQRQSWMSARNPHGCLLIKPATLSKPSDCLWLQIQIILLPLCLNCSNLFHNNQRWVEYSSTTSKYLCSGKKIQISHIRNYSSKKVFWKKAT